MKMLMHQRDRAPFARRRSGAGRTGARRWADLSHGLPVALMVAVALSLAGPATAKEAPDKRQVILFIGDGMGVSTVTAARIHAGQLAGGTGEEHSLTFESFPNVALVKTYNVDLQVPDSAGTMTAIMTGEKTRAGVLSVHQDAARGDCAAAKELPLITLLERAELAGFATGIVTNTTITHATPGAAYAHAAERNWEDDSEMPPEAVAAGCTDIARQLLEFEHGDGLEVMLGGGRRHFIPADQTDPQHPKQTGQRRDGRDLIAQWLAQGSQPPIESHEFRSRHNLIVDWPPNNQRAYAWNLAQLRTLRGSDVRQVLGLFAASHMQFEADRNRDQEPSLAEMTEFAIERLQRDEKGFFLVVEGGRIDHAHHFGNAYRALKEVIALDQAVAKAQAMTDAANTLLLVTADHSHTLTISGYPRRGNPILGKVETAPGRFLPDGRGKPYTTLGYANGPGYRDELADLTNVDTEAADFQQPATYPAIITLPSGVTIVSETHSGEDVAAYAQGLNADALGGVMEQNLLHDVMFTALFGKSPAL